MQLLILVIQKNVATLDMQSFSIHLNKTQPPDFWVLATMLMITDYFIRSKKSKIHFREESFKAEVDFGSMKEVIEPEIRLLPAGRGGIIRGRSHCSHLFINGWFLKVHILQTQGGSSLSSRFTLGPGLCHAGGSDGKGGGRFGSRGTKGCPV